MKHLTIQRLAMGAVALLVGLLLGWMLRGVTTYNSNAGMAETFDDWRLACPAATMKDGSCELNSDVVENENGQPTSLARVTITQDNASKKPILGFTVPLGVALEPGLGLMIDKDPAKVAQYRTCNTVGCIAVLDLDDKLAQSLDGADDVKIALAGLDGKQQQIAVSLKGYHDARSAYKSAEAHRHNWFWRLWS
ncbi:MAG: invasion associated locus B family protein [Alphaproteobacteria bacterium]|nr:invasion associated locus B family protein [Alphaproteobacteria bacterium]